MKRFRSQFKGLLACCAVSACGQNVTPASAIQAQGAELKAQTSRVVTGSRVRHNLVAAGPITNTRDDFAGWDVSAWASSCGSQQSFAASFPRPGAMLINGVPNGQYLLKVSNPTLAFPKYFVTNEREVDLGEYFLGRANAAPAAPGTSLSLSLSGLAPYTPGDDLQLTSAGAGLGFGSFLSVASAAPGAGDSALTAELAYADLTFGGNGGLIDTAQGDVAFITDLVSAPVEGDVLYASSLARAAKVSSLSMVNGASTPLTAQLQAVEQTGHFSSTLDRAAFDAMKHDVNPTAEPIEYDFGIDVAPGGLEHGSISGTPDLAYMGLLPGATNPTVTMNYGNPFPSAWPAFGFHIATYEVDLTVVTPAGALPYTTFVRSIINEPLPSFGSAGIAPKLAPVRNAKIDGAPFFASTSSTNLTPLITWDAPAFGKADFYTVTVTELHVDGTSVSGQKIASVTTRERQLHLPTGVLSASGRYTYTITAVASPHTEPDEAPFLRHYPMFSSDSVSGVLTVGL